MVMVAAVGCMAGGVAVAQSGRGAVVPEIGVCEVFRNPAAYRGKIVAIRGIYNGALTERCGGGVFQLGGRRWVTAINLADSEHAAQHGDVVGFRTERASWDHLDRLAYAKGKLVTRVVRVTAVGRLETVEVRPDGLATSGYGHLGVLPAQLTVQRMDRPVVGGR